MSTLDLLTYLVDLLFVLAGLAAARLWYRHRSPATVWLVATFAAFTAVIATSFLPESAQDNPVVARLVLLVLLVSPYTLFRFALTITPRRDGFRRAAAGATAAILVATVLLPEVPESGADAPMWWSVYLVAVLVVWATLDLSAGWLLFRASVGEPSVVRNRLRTLAAAALGLGLYVPLSALLIPEGDSGDVAQLVAQLVSASLAGLFLVGFAPPSLLRAAWRSRDERRLYEAALGLMVAKDVESVAAVVVPGVRQVMGAPRVVMRAPDGGLLAEAGAPADRVPAVREVQTRDLSDCLLEVVVAPTMPLFGAEEYQQLDRLELLAELAIDRVRLLRAERRAREDVERLNDELEAFVYTTSHDLKNPVIALIGYLDVVGEDYLHLLPEEGRRIFDRMRVNARHMDSLIRDLLELSRVGRVDVTPDRVDLELLVDDVAGDMRAKHPRLVVERGALPDVWMNPTRARQLLTNLMDNAAQYGGREDITVSVSATPLDGGVRLVVRDDGQGIPDEHLDRVFGVFERLEPDHPGGTGMGLAICRRLVESIGGAMVALSDPGGAAFQIDLPPSVLAAAPDPSPALEGSTS